MDEAELIHWAIEHRGNLRDGFAQAQCPEDEAGIWIRQEFSGRRPTVR